MAILDVYEEFGESSRRQILAELRTGPKNVTHLVSITGLKQPNVSNHLSRLRQRGVVAASKVGREVFYSLASPEVEAVIQAAFSQPEPVPAHIDLGKIAQQLSELAIQGDEQACNDLMDDLFRARVPLLDIYQEVLGPSMATVGDWYKEERIDEGQEHLASEITERMMARTVQFAGITKKSNKVAVLGCAENTWHVIGLRMLSDYLRAAGWRALFLGANVPNDAFVAAIRQHRPGLVLVSCSVPESEKATTDLIKRLTKPRERGSRTKVAVGGYYVRHNPQPFLDAGAHFFAPDLRSFVMEVLPAIER